MLRMTPGEEWAAERGHAAYDGLRRSVEPREDAVLVRIASLPVEGPAVLECLMEGPLAMWQAGANFVAQFGVGRSHAQLPAVSARELRLLHSRLAALGARLEVERVPQSVIQMTSPRTEPELADLLLRTKNAFDPDGRFLPLALAGGAP
jgi:hypothetical protein